MCTSMLRQRAPVTQEARKEAQLLLLLLLGMYFFPSFISLSNNLTNFTAPGVRNPPVQQNFYF